MLRSTTSRRYRFQPYSNASIPALVTRHETFAIFTLVFILRNIICAIAVIGVFIPVVLFGSEVLVLPVVILALDHSIAETRLESWAGPPIARTVILLVSLVARVFFFKQKTAYEVGLGIPAEPLFRSLLRFRLPSRLPMMFILWMVAMMVVIIPSRTV